MYRPPRALRDSTVADRTSRGGLPAGYALMAAFPLLLLVIAHPVAGSLLFAALLGTVLAARRVRRLVRCLYECGGFAFDLGGRVRITVARPHCDGA